jgi:hypothetical protein
MSTNREPFVTDADITKAAAIQGDASMAMNKDDFAAGERARGYIHGAHDTRALYEAELSRKDAEIEALRNPWVSTKDRLPDPHVLVCILNEDRFWSTPDDMTANVYAVGWLNTVHGQLYWSIPGERGSDVSAYTHWMPLPTPPTP